MPTLTKPLEAIYQPIQPDLTRVEQALLSELQSVDGFVGEVTRYVAQMLGKRLRPALGLFSAQAVSPKPVDRRVILMAASVELIHTATLVHDDVIDDATLRRGKATVNARWGNTLSVLAGDYLYSQAFCILSRIGSPEVLNLMSKTSQRVCVGEVTQVRHQYDADMSEETYLTIIREKTASLMSAATQAGAELSGGSPSVAQALADFGQAFGTAFQIVDDTHDLVGEEDRLGKSLGTDLEHGKITLPLIVLRDSAAASERSLVREMLLHHGNGASAQTLKTLAISHGVADVCIDKAGILIEEAKESLNVLPPSAARQGLSDLADYVLAF
ncbi:MAG: polyprenyl synthetase family protein [Candidatus Omnitrophica bacterium]|nr:polyprenyl synthetase family protein [Candidatus Omnitrophota bacterium]